jgi:hypothetical protein
MQQAEKTGSDNYVNNTTENCTNRLTLLGVRNGIRYLQGRKNQGGHESRPPPSASVG